MRRSFAWVAVLSLVAVGCDEGGGQPCIVDSDCSDFTEVCVAERCRPAGEVSTEGGVPDSGPRPDGGGGIDAGGTDGGAADGGGEDAAVADGGPMDAAVPPDAPMPCPDGTGVYSVSAILAGPCGSATAGYMATATAGASVCEFAIASNDALMLAADGSFTLDSGGSLVAASSSIDVGGQGAMLCSGALTGDTLTLVCGSCTIQLTR